MKSRAIIFFIIFLMLISSICFATDAIFTWSNNTTKVNINNNVLQTVADAKEENSLKLESGAAI